MQESSIFILFMAAKKIERRKEKNSKKSKLKPLHAALTYGERKWIKEFCGPKTLKSEKNKNNIAHCGSPRIPTRAQRHTTYIHQSLYQMFSLYILYTNKI